MRLITRTVHRAFPELDLFDDERCRRFVRAASAGRLSAALGGMAVALVGGVLSAASIGVSIRLAEQQGRSAADDLPVLIKSGLTLAALLSLSWILAMLTRDGLLRLGVRRVLARYGRCARCGYSLLGMPVTPAPVGDPPGAARITCPECATTAAVDASLGELASEGGETVYRPSLPRIDPTIPQGRREAAKRARRRVEKAAAAACLLALLAYALSWGQALQARSAADPGEAIAAVRASLRADIDGGPVDENEAVGRWSRLAGIVAPATDIVQGREPGDPADRRSAMLLPLALDRGASVAALAYAGVNTGLERAAAEALALRAWQIARDRGLLAELRGLPALVGASPPVPAPPATAWTDLRDLNAAHEILRLDLEMARRAGEDGDRAAYVAVVASMRALHRIVAQQGEDEFPLAAGLYDALRSHLPRTPDAAWLAEVVAAAGPPPGDDTHLAARRELLRLRGRKVIALLFANPHTPLKRLLGMDAGFSRTFSAVGVGTPMLQARWIGTYAGNVAAFDRAVAAPSAPSTPLFPPTGLPVADLVLLLHEGPFVWRRSLRALAHRRWLEMRVELFRLQRGRLPGSWAEALGPDAPERWTIDIETGTPLVIRPAIADEAGGLIFVIEPTPSAAPTRPSTP